MLWQHRIALYVSDMLNLSHQHMLLMPTADHLCACDDSILTPCTHLISIGSACLLITYVTDLLAVPEPVQRVALLKGLTVSETSMSPNIDITAS